MTTKDLQLTEYEEIIATELIHPDDITIAFKDVGGLDSVIKSLQENVIYPLKYPDLYSSFSSLLGCPKGVLLYGPPGCGKTMLAKALAKESGAIFINLHVSTLTDKVNLSSRLQSMPTMNPSYYFCCSIIPSMSYLKNSGLANLKNWFTDSFLSL